MLFNSYEFLIFLPVTYLLYWAVSRRWQNALLLAASYLFYGWWDWRFLGLIVLSSAVDYAAGLGIAHGRARRGWLGFSLVANLGVLGFFKYFDFGIESFAALLQLLGFTPHLPTLGLILPVGISFYTFQTLSYSIDVYRGRLEPTRDALAFFTFVAFFPQLVAGPIERAGSLLPYFLRDRELDADRATDGCRQMLYGLLLKIVVADNLAVVVNAGYMGNGQRAGTVLLFATYAFAFQIYGDFAGYSHIAIGCARLFGIDLQRNFAYPYFSQSPAEFWRRWHISLSTWFRDYVYIPLGGSRRGGRRTALNVFVTFLLSGLWHGAGLTYIVWGGLHGLLVAAQRQQPPTDLNAPAPRFSVKTVVGILVTFHLTCAAWVFFRATSVPTALTILAKIGKAVTTANLTLPNHPQLLLIVLVILIEWMQRRRPHPFCLEGFPTLCRWTVYGLAVLAIALFGRINSVPFIYFQF